MAVQGPGQERIKRRSEEANSLFFASEQKPSSHESRCRRQVLKLRHDPREQVSRRRWTDFNSVKYREAVHKLRFSCGQPWSPRTVMPGHGAHAPQRPCSYQPAWRSRGREGALRQWSERESVTLLWGITPHGGGVARRDGHIIRRSLKCFNTGTSKTLDTVGCELFSVCNFQNTDGYSRSAPIWPVSAPLPLGSPHWSLDHGIEKQSHIFDHGQGHVTGLEPQRL